MLTIGAGIAVGVFALIAAVNFWRETKEALTPARRRRQPWDID